MLWFYCSYIIVNIFCYYNWFESLIEHSNKIIGVLLNRSFKKRLLLKNIELWYPYGTQNNVYILQKNKSLEILYENQGFLWSDWEGLEPCLAW